MKIKFYGVRGSYPLASGSTTKYGGHSTCIYIQSDSGSELIFDCGSGLKNLGDAFKKEDRLYFDIPFIISHTHWDHVLGLPFFKPFWNKYAKFEFYAPKSDFIDVESFFKLQHVESYFPVPFEKLKSEINFYSVEPGTEFQVKEFNIKTFQLNHPGVTIGYRIEADGKVLVILTDTAPMTENNILGDYMNYTDSVKIYNEKLKKFVRNADLVIHDTHFSEEEIKGFEHWGHSTPNMAVDLCCGQNVKNLMLFHHAPSHNDEMLDKIEAETRIYALDKNILIKINTAMEGEVVSL